MGSLGCSVLYTLGFLLNYGWCQSLGYAYFDFEGRPNQGFYTMDATIDIVADPGDEVSLFMSHQFFFLAGNGGYMGLQTNGEWNDAIFRNKPYNSSTAIGKMAIFSIWSALDCRTSDPTNKNIECIHGTESGAFWSIHMKLDWIADSYRFRMMQHENINDGKWWNVTIYDDTSNKEYNMGSIKVPDGWYGITTTDAFLEKYSSPSGCVNLPKYASFVYGQQFLIVNNQTMNPYNSSYKIGAGGIVCPCVSATINKDKDYQVDYIIDQSKGGCT